MKALQHLIVSIVLGTVLLTAGLGPVYAVAKNLADPNTFGAAQINPGGTVNSFESLAAQVINFILGLLGIIAVILILVSGWQWMTADSEDKVKEARKRLMNSVIGLAIVALAWVIAFAIVNTIAKITTS
ncbi:MAG: pilin [Patescibacteria group bacterium]